MNQRIRIPNIEGAYKLVFVKYKNNSPETNTPTKALIQVFNVTKEDNGYSFNDYADINKDSSAFVDAFELDETKLETLSVLHFGELYYSTSSDTDDKNIVGQITDQDIKIITEYVSTQIKIQSIENTSWDTFTTDIDYVDMLETQQIRFWDDFE